MNKPQIVPILMYHSIASDVNSNWRQYTVPPFLFAEHMRYLRENHYQPITVASFTDLLATGSELPANPVILTFDDGHGDFSSTAIPILQGFDIGATLYVTTNLIGQRSPWQHCVGEPGRPMLSWSELRAISALGVECGAHGVTHQQLDTLPRAEALMEVIASKRNIEDKLGRSVATFCYPHGCYDAAVRAMVVNTGYNGACSTTRAVSNSADDLFGLARIQITCDTTVDQLAGLLVGNGLPLAPLPERWRTRAWRFVRRQRERARRTSRARDLQPL
jgi:peptidoglycan/xylan/chitin deacetylase (PgdA/CDA1 family)